MKKFLLNPLRVIPFALMPLLFTGIATTEGLPGAHAATQPDTSKMDGRLGFVQKLIQDSSAARQVAASENPQARAKHEQARTLYESAVDASRAGDQKRMDELLNEAAKTMFEAAREAGQETVVDGKKRDDYAARLESINALLDAHQRVSAEKNVDASGLRGAVQAKIDEANAIMRGGDLDAARKVLDEGYLAAKVAIEELRGGDTLVRTLEFASKEEEYHYELDRNDTHKMLISVLLKEKLENPGIGRMVQPFIDKAQALRVEAEGQAGAGDFDTAVGTLEESTKNLVRAIRGAGIYIPG